jgi:N6-adenosine-specific RNA methylase IME4
LHRLAGLFPLMQGDELDELVGDMQRRGFRPQFPIITFDGQIIDGRNRARAAQKAGVEPLYMPFQGKAEDVTRFIVSANIHRRHLSPEDRRDLLKKLLGFYPTLSDRAIARMAKASPTTVGKVRSTVQSGQLRSRVGRDGRTRKIPEREILQRAKEIRAQKTAVRRSESIERLAELSKSTSALPTGQRYPVIYADPPWYFEAYDSVSGTGRTAESHYPCMQTEDICAMPVSELATDDAVLFLWTIAPHLQESFRVIEAWGFRYVTNAVWVKDKIGLGYYVRNQHELLLIAVRGNIPAPAPAQRPLSVIQSPRRQHSRKPDEAYALIERMYPELPRIELFARHARKGWDAWGNEAPKAAA